MNYYDRLSHSALQDYASCGEKFRLRRIVKVPRVPGWALVGGNAVHRATEALDLADFGIKENLPLTFRDAFKLEIEDRQQWTDVPPSEWKASGRSSKAYPCKEDRSWWEANGQAQVDAWRHFLATGPYQIWVTPDMDPAIELRLAWPIGGVPTRGIVDRVLEDTRDGSLTVCDIKAGARLPIAADQLDIYGHGLAAIFGEACAPRWGCYFMTRKAETSLIEDVSSARDGRLEYIFRAARDGIDQGRFLPSPGQQCYSCDVREWCYALRGPSAEDVSPYKMEAT